MTNELIITLLALLSIGSLAAAFVLWAKLDEQKQKTQEEQYRRWDEISRAVGLENELEQSKTREKCSVQPELWYAEQMKYWKEANDDKIKDILHCHKECEKLATERDALQDFKSSKICPHNDHVWKDGVCTKCGRIKEK